MTEVEQSREDRIAAFRAITMRDRRARHDRIAAELAVDLDRRRELGTQYLASYPPSVVIDRELAVAVADLRDETAAAREEAMELARGRRARVDNGALEFPVLSHHFDAGGPVIDLAKSEPLLSAVIAYFGMVPVLYNIFVTRAHNTEFRPTTAHRFHIDPEDIVSLKVFVHLTDVDHDCGPFHALRADRAREILEAVDYRGVDYLDDDQIAEMAGWDSVVAATGPAGTAAFADTSRCLHFGGRPRAAGKPVREMIVYQYLLPTSTLLAGSGDEPPRRFLPQLVRRGDERWDALLGEILPGWPPSTVTTGA